MTTGNAVVWTLGLAFLAVLLIVFVACSIAGGPGRFFKWMKTKAWPKGIKPPILWTHRRFLPSLLFLSGLAVIGFTLALWVVGGETASSTVQVHSTAIAPVSTPTGTGKTATGMSTTSVNSSTITDTPAATRPSDALFATFLGIGLSLLLTGAFFYRITSIKFPGGELVLAAQATAAVAKVTSQAQQDNVDGIKAAGAITAAALTARATTLGLSPSDDFAEKAAIRARQIIFGA